MISVALLFGLLLGNVAESSERIAAETKILSSAPFVFVGRVLESTLDSKSFQGVMEVLVLTEIKGSLGKKTIRIKANQNPINGFDILLKKDEIAVFFLRDVEASFGRLVDSGAIATLPAGYYR